MTFWPNIRFTFFQAIEDDLLTEGWARLQQYASWMRGLHLGSEQVLCDTFLQLSRSSAGGVLFPRLEWLVWEVGRTDIPLPCFHLFFPPQLKEVALYAHHRMPDIPKDQIAALVHIISFLTSSLEDLTLKCGQRREALLEDAISSFVCQRGSSLRRFDSDVPLSEAAVHHLMQLPNLRSWVALHEPPRTLPPVTFPSLQQLRLGQAALPWLHLLALHEKVITQNGFVSATSHSSVRETLEFLDCPRNTIIDLTFLSSVVNFRNLVKLRVAGDCPYAGDCIFCLTDDDVENLAAALPHLISLQLMRPCQLNSCKTTISCLLSLSTHCLGLEFLEIHFNTRTIVANTRRLLDGSSGRGKAKCQLSCLRVGYLPLKVCGEDIETVAMGFKVIFPWLRSCHGRGQWLSVGAALEKIQD